MSDTEETRAERVGMTASFNARMRKRWPVLLLRCALAFLLLGGMYSWHESAEPNFWLLGLGFWAVLLLAAVPLLRFATWPMAAWIMRRARAKADEGAPLDGDDRA